MNKKYQIFISSTYKDLVPEREKVRDVILSMYQFPIGMEMFSAADEKQWEIIKDTIDSSDYYVLILGKRYGSVIGNGPDRGISYTEKEYRYAKSIGIPILAYIKVDEAITADNVDDDSENLKKLEEFKNDVTKDREVKWFSSIDQLGTEVLLSLHKEMDRKKRPGWIRSDAVDIEKSLSEIVELSRKNRELQEENKRISLELEKLKVSHTRTPLLTVELDLTEPGSNEKNPELFQRRDLIRIDDDDIIHLKLKKLTTTEKESEYFPIKRSDIPMGLKRYVSEQAIEDYNASLPTEEEMENYLSKYKKYLRLRENGVPITFFINNLGKAKATDVSVTIEFPEQVRIFDFEEVINISEPSSPKKPENPIEKARKKIETERAFALNLNYPVRNGFISASDYSAILASSVRRGTVFESIEIEDNTVEINQKQGIVHTKFDFFPGGYIVPLSPGEFEAKVTLMCAEYENPEEIILKFIVEE